PDVSVACRSFASIVADAPSTPVEITARKRWKFLIETQPDTTVATPCETGSRLAASASISDPFWFGVMVYLLGMNEMRGTEAPRRALRESGSDYRACNCRNGLRELEPLAGVNAALIFG